VRGNPFWPTISSSNTRALQLTVYCCPTITLGGVLAELGGGDDVRQCCYCDVGWLFVGSARARARSPSQSKKCGGSSCGIDEITLTLKSHSLVFYNIYIVD
jgi:hypothetical protein